MRFARALNWSYRWKKRELTDKTASKSPREASTKKEFPKREREEAPENMLEGRNAVTEALSAGRTIDKLFVADGDTDRALARICAMAKQAGAVVVPTDRRKLDYMSATGAHQGRDCHGRRARLREYRRYFKEGAGRGRAAADRHLRRVVRSPQSRRDHSYCRVRGRAWNYHSEKKKRGADGGCRKAPPRARSSICRLRAYRISRRLSIRSKRRACGSTARRRRAIRRSTRQTSKSAAAIVIGNEGEGMSRLVSERCDFKVSIPMKGSISSLNASAAAAIMLYEAVRQRSLTDT